MATFPQEPVIVPRSKQVRRLGGSAPAISTFKDEQPVTPQVEQQRAASLRSLRGPSQRSTRSTPKATVSRENLRVLQQQLSQKTPPSTTATKDLVTLEQEQRRARELREQQLQTRIEQAQYRQTVIASSVPATMKRRYKVGFLFPVGLSAFKDLLDLANADMVISSITADADLGFFTSLGLNTFDGIAFSGLMFVLTLLLSIPLVFWFMHEAKKAKIPRRQALMWGLIGGYFAEMTLFGVNLLPGMVIASLWGLGYIKMQSGQVPGKKKSKPLSRLARGAALRGGKSLFRKVILKV